MAWNRKTLSEHIAAVTGQIESSISGGSAILRNSLLSVFARVIAAAINGFEGFLENEARNQHTATMDAEHLKIEAADYGIIPKTATFAEGVVTINGTLGSFVEEGELLIRSDGVEFAIDADVTFLSNQQIAKISAIEPGANGNTIPFVNLSFVSPIIGVQSQVQIDANGLNGGNDEEDIESLRSRILERKASPPRGGSKADYIRWAKEIAGVTRAWVIPDYLGEGSIGVAFVFDNRPDIFPTPEDVAIMQNYLLERVPVTQESRTFAFSPVPKPINMQIELVPDSLSVRATVAAELKNFIQYSSSPGATTLLSQLRATISMADGEIDNTIIAPIDNINHTPNEMPILGNIAWIS